MGELSESPEVITQKPAFVIFMEGGDKDEQVRGQKKTDVMTHRFVFFFSVVCRLPLGFIIYFRPFFNIFFVTQEATPLPP